MGFGKKGIFGAGDNKATTPPPPPPETENQVASPAAPSPAPVSTEAEASTPLQPAPPPSPAKEEPAKPEVKAPSNADVAKAHGMKMPSDGVAEDGLPIQYYTDPQLETDTYKQAKWQLVEKMLLRLDFKKIEHLARDAKVEKIRSAASTLIPEINIPLNAKQHDLLQVQIIDEILGFGPLEPLMQDHEVSDIMINTCAMVYIEKAGKLMHCDVAFASEKHLLNVITRIVSLVGRRVDESSPMVDARMPDGSRFNAIIPPLAIDGSLVSIRKFKKNKMPLRDYVKYESMTPEMAEFLEVCGRIRLNVLVSGGTGSGKTTLLNALSGNIDPGERVITIEDAAELQLHQPHVLRLETRPPNSEGVGEVTQRALVKNALRMRPDRIILGEIRGDEVIDVLAAMNTGHEGSMATIHANNPRDCLSRIENLIGLAGFNLPINAMRAQIASAINLIVQLSRMRDGSRRITHIEEVVGMEGEIITTQKIFGFKPGSMGSDGKLTGKFEYTGIKPRFYEQAVYFNEEDKLLNCLQRAAEASGTQLAGGSR